MPPFPNLGNIPGLDIFKSSDTDTRPYPLRKPEADSTIMREWSKETDPEGFIDLYSLDRNNPFHAENLKALQQKATARKKEWEALERARVETARRDARPARAMEARAVADRQQRQQVRETHAAMETVKTPVKTPVVETDGVDPLPFDVVQQFVNDDTTTLEAIEQEKTRVVAALQLSFDEDNNNITHRLNQLFQSFDPSVVTRIKNVVSTGDALKLNFDGTSVTDIVPYTVYEGISATISDIAGSANPVGALARNWVSLISGAIPILQNIYKYPVSAKTLELAKTLALLNTRLIGLRTEKRNTDAIALRSVQQGDAALMALYERMITPLKMLFNLAAIAVRGGSVDGAAITKATQDLEAAVKEAWDLDQKKEDDFRKLGIERWKVDKVELKNMLDSVMSGGGRNG